MSRAYILGELDLELAKAREKFAAFAREVQQNPLKVGVDIARKGDRSTLAGQTIDGPDAELSPSSPAAGGRRLDAQEALQQRWLYTAPASSLGGSTGQPIGRPLPTAAQNSVYGSMGYGRVAGAYGTTQAMPGVPVPMDVVGQAQARSRAAQWQDDQDRRVAAVRYGQFERGARDAGFVGPLISPRDFASPGGRAEALDEVSRARAEVTRERRAIERTIRSIPAVDPPTSADRQFGGSSLGGNTGGAGFFPANLLRNLRTATTGYFAIQAAEGAFASQTARDIAVAQAGGDPFAIARARIDNDPMRTFVGSVPIIGGLATSAADYFGGRVGTERTFASAQMGQAITAAIGQRGDLQRQATQATGVARAGLAGQSAAQIASIANLRADIDDGVTRRAYLAANGQAERDQLIAAGERVNQVRSAGTSIGSRLQSFVSTGSTAGDTQAAAKALADAESAYETARQQVAKVEAKADDYVAQIRSANEAQREVIRQSASDARTTTNQTTEGVSAAFARTVGGDRFGGQQAMLEATIAPQIEQINREIARLDNVEGSGDLIRERVAAREALQQQLDRGTQQNSLDAGRFRILQQGQVQAGRLDLAFNPLGAQLASINAGVTADTLGMNPNSPDYQLRRQQGAVDAARARQQFVFRNQSLANSLRADSRSIDFGFERNAFGAQAAGLVGDAQNTLQGLSQAGFGEDKIEKARENFLRRIDLSKRDYSDSFRGTQVDLQNLLINNPRDGQDPSAVFRSFDEAKLAIANTDARAGEISTTAGETDKGFDYDKFEQSVEAAFKRALADAVTN